MDLGGRRSTAFHHLERGPSRFRGLAICGSAVVLSLALATILNIERLEGLSLQSLSWLSLMLSGTAYVVMIATLRGGVWSASAIFMVIAMLFHQGLLIYSATGVSQPIEGSAGLWFGTLLTRRAVIVVTVALLAFAAGATLSGSFSTRARSHVEAEGGNRRAFARAGLVILVLSICAWYAAAVISLGPTFMFSTYRQWLTATSVLPLGYVYFGIGIGFTFALSGVSSKSGRRVLFVFAAFAVAALPLGLRGEVLFPLAAGSAVYARSHVMPRKRVAVVLVIATLGGISLIQQVRQVGVGEFSLSEATVSPLQGVAELGASLRTVDAVIGWQLRDGSASLRGGVTYTAPLERVLQGRLMGQEIPDARIDMRLLNVEMRVREGPIGGSFVAEAYRNFGTNGCVFVSLFLGLLLGAFDRLRTGVAVDSLLAVVMVAALQHVRNSFTPIPLQLGLGLLLTMALLVMTTRRRKSYSGTTVIESSTHARRRIRGAAIRSSSGEAGTSKV